MEITVRLDEAVVAEATRRAFADMFRAPQYSHERGTPGYEAVRGQVLEYIATLDVREQVQQVARLAIGEVVQDVVGAEIRRYVKVEAKRLREEGTLFEEKATP